LAAGYAGVARALVERKAGAALAAAESLDAARRESDAGWWERQYPNPLESAWRAAEHEAVCTLLGAVARRAAEWLAEEGRAAAVDENDSAEEFARAVDDALVRLSRFVTRDANHHPKLYVWLPGLALCALAASARLPVGWLAERHESKTDGYERLPPELLQNPPAQ
ncbi:MAG TPA: hypothetical protein VER32_11360, partial [Pyrinomonadaceae bacterium]|nr:hypothetical protein [Pyrinomonadaceae bacterium]